jgi:CHAT domain-containing protein
MHLATHGFFLQRLRKSSNNKQEDTISGKHRRLLAFDPLLKNPLLHSGLALAGANSWIKHKPLPSLAEDGLLTAEDVLHLDLTYTLLVVLSACETGLGAIVHGEGVFGFRRAFMLGGAQTLIMSLWQVPDEQTKHLMIDFYNMLNNGTPVSQALRNAQLKIKEGYGDPFYWGAFICQGNPDMKLAFIEKRN